MTRRSLLFAFAAGAARRAWPSPRKFAPVLVLAPRPGNPRNSEGDFIQLRDGRLLFAYSRFGGEGEDHDPAEIVTRFSTDGGRTWSAEDQKLVHGEGKQNVMSVSFLRLADGRIALFYGRKNSITDCQPLVRFSSDEARTWSDPILCTPEDGYFVLNNDRAVQLARGRIVLPVALHTAGGKWSSRGVAMCYLSDDGGRSWRRCRQLVECPADSRNGLQEPGVVELNDGRLMMFARTDLGSQYVSYSDDGGEHWSRPEPSSLLSPLSPASIERIPKTGDLLAVWNDHSRVPQQTRRRGLRTPLTVAISKDEGGSWIHRKHLEELPEGYYCYTAIEFVDDHVLLAYMAADWPSGLPIGTTVLRLPIDFLYA